MSLRAELSRRLRTASPAEWREFAQLWIAFNAIYGGEPDPRERSRVMACIRNSFSEKTALKVLRSVTPAVNAILEVPPGDMRLEQINPRFRAASTRLVGVYRDKKETALNRLAAVAGVLYQVRCNLVHGSKRPDNERDRMLVTESLHVLNALVPALEDQLSNKSAA